MSTCLASDSKRLAALQALKRLHVWDADFKKMRERHRAAALRLHPDKVPTTSGGEDMRALNGAYAMAKTPELHYALLQVDQKVRAREEERARAQNRREAMQKQTEGSALGKQGAGGATRGVWAGEEGKLEGAEKRKEDLMAKLREHDRKAGNAAGRKRNGTEQRKREEEKALEGVRKWQGEAGGVLTARIFCEDSGDEKRTVGKERNGTEEEKERRRRGLEDFARGVEFRWREELRKARAQMGYQTTILDKLREEARRFDAGEDFCSAVGPPEGNEARTGENARARGAQTKRDGTQRRVDELINSIKERILIIELQNEERQESYRATRMSENGSGL